MAHQTTEENAKPRTGFDRIADELHFMFCSKIPAKKSCVHNGCCQNPVQCYYLFPEHELGVVERTYWLERAKEINDIVREELVR